MSLCPLCLRPNQIPFQTEAYSRCLDCQLILKRARPTAQAEKARYLTHNNDNADPGYRQFLSPVSEIIRSRASKSSHGLDYGSGPTAALTGWLQEEGYQVTGYDSFFQPDTLAGDQRYDYISCTETAEHFFEPRQEFERIFARLKPGGFLVLMTSLYREGLQLSDWWYTRDFTHVCFYSRETLRWIANHFEARLEFVNEQVFVFVLDTFNEPSVGTGNQFDKIM